VALSDQAENIRRAFYHFLAELKGDFLHQGDFYSHRMGNGKNCWRVDNRKSGCRLGKKHEKKYILIF
jgi:hypothetical protein